MQNCELCAFRNPKSTVTAVIIQDNKVLLLKRADDPFKDMWDFPGGYVSEFEPLDIAIRREVGEELGVNVKSLVLINSHAGIAYWNNQDFPVMNHFYLTEIHGEIKLDKENTAYTWIPLKELNPQEIAFDSNQRFAYYLKQEFGYDLARVKELIGQLDNSVEFNEQFLYKAVIDGYVAKEYDGDKLVGMGWIFPRQTLLRKQAVVEDMIVDSAYQGKHLGKKVLLQLLDWAKSQGVDTVELTTNPKRIAANGLYQKVGFKLHPTNHYLLKL